MKYRILTAVVLSFVLSNAIVFGQRVSWQRVQYEMSIPEHKSQSQIKNELLAFARNKAVQQASGVEHQTATLNSGIWLKSNNRNDFFESFRILSSTSARGLILEEESPEYSLSSTSRLNISYRARVGVSDVKIDPAFTLSTDINREVFKVGDELLMKVKASKTSFLTIFSIAEDETATMIFPNTYMQDQRLEAFETRQVPSEKESQSIAFTIQPHPNNESEFSEVLMFVATKTPYIFDKLQGEDLNYNTTWITINRWLMSIPANDRVTFYNQYLVME